MAAASLVNGISMLPTLLLSEAPHRAAVRRAALAFQKHRSRPAWKAEPGLLRSTDQSFRLQEPRQVRFLQERCVVRLRTQPRPVRE